MRTFGVVSYPAACALWALAAVCPPGYCEPIGAATVVADLPSGPREDGGNASKVRFAALLRRAQTYRESGHLVEAEDDLEQAARIARELKSALAIALADLSLGELRAQQGRFDEAERLLQKSRGVAAHFGNDTIAAMAANALGNLAAERNRPDRARTFYQAALDSALRAADPGIEATARRNLALDSRSAVGALRKLREARQAAARVDDFTERAALLLSIAQAARDRADLSAHERFAEDCLDEAIAASPDGSRLRSTLLAELAKLRETQSRPHEAAALLAAAILEAGADAHESQYEWEWRLARLWRELGDSNRAIAAYRRAVGHLQQLRPLIPITYRDGRSSFRETLSPLYLEFADLLLQKASPTGSPEPVLREARDVIERFKLDELRDYLSDPCIIPRSGAIDRIRPRTAAIYPISFADRLDLLVSIDGSLFLESVPFGNGALAALARQFTGALRKGEPSHDSARALYRVLIAPFEKRLIAASVDTLVFVPDGVLRTIPLSALELPDGFLIERYAVATVPGIRLLAITTPPQSKSRRALLAGLSRPGPVIAELPSSWLTAKLAESRTQGREGPTLTQPRTTGQYRGSRSLEPSVPPRHEGSVASTPGVGRQAIIQALALRGVGEEIRTLSELIPSRTLIDERFTLRGFEQALASGGFDSVHIATHGMFGPSAKESFLVTYDRKLDIDDLARILRAQDRTQNGLDLLVLSACETAEGDDRAPLGLSGVALRAGARSVIGSLWPVDDNATRLLMGTFYARLAIPGTSKAQALREAQLSLLNSAAFMAPHYWAPFVLVGNGQ